MYESVHFLEVAQEPPLFRKKFGLPFLFELPEIAHTGSNNGSCALLKLMAKSL
jgi:hypothetical protein